jgi:hypothetical protein
MFVLRSFSVFLLVAALGCGAQPTSPEAGPFGPDHTRGQSPGNRSALTDLATKYQISQRPDQPQPANPLTLLQQPKVLRIDGLWVPSGWMGDAPAGGIRHRLEEQDSHSPPTCEEWTYDPSAASLYGWAAVSYQYPENNWGDQAGRDLGGKYTRLRVALRGKRGGEQLVLKSGGHTRPGCPHPASYETSSSTITLTQNWTVYDVPVGPDTTNVPSAFTFVVTRAANPDGCVFYVDDIAFVAVVR